MKKLHFILCVLFISTGLYSQSPQGGRGGQGGFGGSGRRQGMPPDGRMNRSSEKRFTLESFPEIPGLTLEQRMEIGIVLGDERKDMEKLTREKQELMMEEQKNSGWDAKKIEKNNKKKIKIDQKIRKRIVKSDKKIKKKLSGEQYAVFLEKRGEIKFRMDTPPPARPERDGMEGNPDFRNGNPPPGRNR
jgi:hypothetical protein